MKKYSATELVKYGKTFDDILVKSKETKYSRELVYALTKNLRLANEELQDVKSMFRKAPERYTEYNDLLKEAAMECGGQKHESGVDITVDDFDAATFDVKQDELNERFADVLYEVKQINEENATLRDKPVAAIEWYPLQLEWFPEMIDYTELPYVILDLIEE